MQIEIDPQSDVPIYQQLRDRVVEAVASGELAPGESLASVRQLALAFGINVATVGKGYELLRREGLIRTNHKSGSVIARGPRSGPASPAFEETWRPRLVTLLAEAFAQGTPPETIHLLVEQTLAGFERPDAAGGIGERPHHEEG